MKLKNKIEAEEIGCTINLSMKVDEDGPEKFSIFFGKNGKVLGTDYPFEPFRRFLIFAGKRLKREIKKCLVEDITVVNVDVEITGKES